MSRIYPHTTCMCLRVPGGEGREGCGGGGGGLCVCVEQLDNWDISEIVVYHCRENPSRTASPLTGSLVAVG
jgi:hypothetical protein